MTDHRALAAEIHQSNITAGWWSMGVENRNRGEVMMLIVSELAEAAEGYVGGLQDDKLPQLPMFDVELADTAIRLYDLIGADAIDAPFDWDFSVDRFCEAMHRGHATADLMLVVRAVAAAMEGHRKGKLDVYGNGLWVALTGVYAMAEIYGDHPLDDVIAQKRAFNAVREDHRLEVRMAEGGKKY